MERGASSEGWLAALDDDFPSVDHDHFEGMRIRGERRLEEE